MEAVSRLKKIVVQGPALLRAISPEDVAKPTPGKWSTKQELGHLVDSACNNHQRFVRAALQGQLTFPGYDQEKLVVLQRYQDLDWGFLIELWTTYNKFLIHVLRNLPASAHQVTCHIAEFKPATLGWIAEDYVAHMKHHLNQIFGKKFESTYSASAY